MSSPVITVSELLTGYERAITLNRISFNLEAGHIHAIIGRSGCGKTTLLKNLLGLMHYRSGSVKVLDAEMNHPDDIAKKKVRARTGVLFQRGALLNSMTVLENVALPLTLHTTLPKETIRDRSEQLLLEVGLKDAGRKRPTELSGGMVKRAALARALALKPEILFCDEPSAGLDPLTTRGIDELLLKVRAENHMTIVIITHDLESIRRIADTLLFLHDRTLAFQGPTSEALRTPLPPLRDFFTP